MCIRNAKLYFTSLHLKVGVVLTATVCRQVAMSEMGAYFVVRLTHGTQTSDMTILNNPKE
jgi:hypothetical protein